MPNLRRFSAAQIETLAGAIRQRLVDRLITPAGLQALVEDLKFRDQVGDTWTIGPITGKWYRFDSGHWSPAPARPDASLDGRVDFDIFGDPREVKLPEPPAQAAVPGSITDIGAYITTVVEAVARAYGAGQIHSDSAEALLGSIYAVDAGGAVWSLGVRSRLWYTFTGSGWQPSQQPLDNASFRTASGVQPAEEHALRFLAFTGNQFPESMVPAWEPPTDFPESTRACSHCQALNVGNLEDCVSCKRPLTPAATAAPRPPSPARASASPPPAASASAPPPGPATPAPRPTDATPQTPAAPAPATKRASGRRWLYVGAAGCLLIACACAALLLALNPTGALRGLTLFPESSPQAEQPADSPPIEAPELIIPASRFALEDNFDDPTRTATPLFPLEIMDFEVDSGVGVMTSHYNGVLAATYDSPVVGDFTAVLEMQPLDPAPGAGYGLIFRSDDAADGLAYYYVALVAPADGVVTLTRWDTNGAAELVRSPYTSAMGDVMQLTVRADGSRIDIDIDGIPASTVIDESTLGPGIFGLAIYSPAVGDQVLFTRLVVEAASP